MMIVDDSLYRSSADMSTTIRAYPQNFVTDTQTLRLLYVDFLNYKNGLPINQVFHMAPAFG